MYRPNMQQVFWVQPDDEPWIGWVLLLCLKSKTQIENEIRSRHDDIELTLASQNVHYTEITTGDGRNAVYAKFGFASGKHPLFLILNKHPLDYTKNDRLLVVEWGKWDDIENLREDLMRLVNFFSNDSIREQIVHAKNPSAWKKIQKFCKDNGVAFVSLGATIGTAFF